MIIDNFETIDTSWAAHSDLEKGICAKEIDSFLAGGQWTYPPQCVCPVLAQFTWKLNDSMPQEWRDRLQPLIPKLIGTFSPDHKKARAEFLAMQAVTIFAPIALEKVALHEQADILREQVDLREAQFAAPKAFHAAALSNARDAVKAASTAVYCAAHACDDGTNAQDILWLNTWYTTGPVARRTIWANDKAEARSVAYIVARAAANAAASSVAGAAANPVVRASSCGVVHAAANAAPDKSEVWPEALSALEGAIELGPHGENYTDEQVERRAE